MNMTKSKNVKNMVLAAMFLALGLVLPFFTGQIPQIGSMLLPMHIPVFLCGLICGWQYGAAVGFVVPLLRSVLFGMPPLFPTALSMAFELLTYGLVVGLLYSRSRWQCVRALYRCLVLAMVAGRAVWGVVQAVLLGLTGSAMTFQIFLAGALLNAIPGIIVQLGHHRPADPHPGGDAGPQPHRPRPLQAGRKPPGVTPAPIHTANSKPPRPCERLRGFLRAASPMQQICPEKYSFPDMVFTFLVYQKSTWNQQIRLSCSRQKCTVCAFLAGL